MVLLGLVVVVLGLVDMVKGLVGLVQPHLVVGLVVAGGVLPGPVGVCGRGAGTEVSTASAWPSRSLLGVEGVGQVVEAVEPAEVRWGPRAGVGRHVHVGPGVVTWGGGRGSVLYRSESEQRVCIPAEVG
jgi:hypothetical protein